MLTDFPADLAAAQIDAEYIYPISTGAYWGRLMTVGLESHGVTEFKDPFQEQLPELRTHAGANDAFQRAMAEIDRREAAGLPTASYGVADSPEQFFAAYPGLAADERSFAVMFWVHRKADQPAHGGWRWSKWGEYVGEQDSQAEYLHDEPEIEQVVSFEIYEITGDTV